MLSPSEIQLNMYDILRLARISPSEIQLNMYDILRLARMANTYDIKQFRENSGVNCYKGMCNINVVHIECVHPS